MNQEKFGAFVCELRKEKEMTQKELGNILGISDKAISKWERGVSLPDITMFDKIAETLGVSTLELMEGQRLDEEKVDRREAEIAVRDTVGQAVIQQKRAKKRTIFYTLLTVVIVLTFWISIKHILNYALDQWTEENESMAHRCELSTYYANDHVENYYISVEPVDEYVWDYHVYGVGAEGNSQKLFTLRENGMKLDRNPKLICRDNSLYILFEGLDNEDPVERIYDEKIGADPQGFIPCLYRYDIEQGTLEEIAVERETETMLVDAFSYEGEDIYISQQFKGIFALHLGFYIGDKTYSSQGIGEKYPNLFGDGGLKSTGCIDGDYYYVLGQEGIYGIDLITGDGAYQKEVDFSYCYRGEMQKLTVDGEERYVVAAAFYDELGDFGSAKTLRTVVTVYDKNWNEINEVELPVGMSAIEWGSESAVITAFENNWEYGSYLVNFKDGSTRKLDEIDCELYPDMEHLDEAECLAEQWVYVKSSQGYYYTSEEPVFVAE